MNRAIIITIGIIIIILVLGVWVYLMFFGTPDNSKEVFANLGFEIAQQDTTITPPVNNQPLDTLVDTQSRDALRQLTTRPIAGFTFASTSAGQTVRYIERGTGHMYEINLESGQEDMLSRTTIPQVSSAVFAPSGKTVALTSYNEYQSNVFVGTLADDVNLSGITLQPDARNLSFSTDNEVLYTVATNGTTKGYTHNIQTLSQSEVFSMNYTNLDIAWGGGLDKTYLTTKPSRELEGFIYTTEDNTLTPATYSAYGLSALFTNDSILTTSIQDDSYISSVIDSTGKTQNLPILALKEKCVFDTFSANYVWCAAPISEIPASFVENWYKGTVTSADNLWLVNTANQTAQLYANPENLVGRTIDVKNIDTNTTGDYLAFTNKIDHTLWLYDLTIE